MNLKPGKLNTLTLTAKKGKNPESEEIVEMNMSQVSNGLVESNIRNM